MPISVGRSLWTLPQVPFVKSDWPVPPGRPPALRDWISPTFASRFPVAANNPAVLLRDWPVPPGPRRWPQDWVRSPFIPFIKTLDTATSAWISAVISNGGTVSAGRAITVDALIVSLKNAGIWTKLDYLWLFAGENAPSARTDIRGLQLATLSVTPPTFTADRGYTGNSSSAFIDTGIANNFGTGGYQRDAASFFAWNNTSGADAGGLAGTNTSARHAAIFPEYIDTNSYSILNGDSAGWTFIFANDPAATGLYLLNRTSSVDVTLDINGTQSQSTSTDTSFALTADTFTALVAFGGSNYSGRQCSALGLGGALSGTDRTNINSYLRTYMTAVGVP